MIVSFHLLAFVFNDYFTPDWQKDVLDISRQVVAALFEADDRCQSIEASLTLLCLPQNMGNSLLLFTTFLSA